MLAQNDLLDLVRELCAGPCLQAATPAVARLMLYAVAVGA